MNLIKDNMLRRMDELKDLVQKEQNFQIAKWGIQERAHPEWLMYLTEEVGELAEAMANQFYDKSEEHRQRVLEESIQVATLALKIAEMHLPEEKEDE